MPMIATTIINSISVNPFSDRINMSDSRERQQQLRPWTADCASI
jgi:hypothetical protein